MRYTYAIHLIYSYMDIYISVDSGTHEPCGGVWTMMGLALREQLERHMLHWNSAILGTMMGSRTCSVLCIRASLRSL